MTRRRILVLAASILVAALAGQPAGPGARVAAEPLPQRLTNQEFWRLATDFSEPDGTFHSENLVSNEARYQYVLPMLVERARPGRAYMGVGSEQNFTYIAALRPSIAFIVDIRRGNLDLHLMYKALFELSTDRADFVSRLFSRPRPAGLGPASTAREIFAAYAGVPSSKTLYDRNLKAITDLLVGRHGFSLLPGDLEGIEFVFGNYFIDGPGIHYQLNGGGGRGGGFPTYADLMVATDTNGRNRSYLATEASFAYLKDLETRNMIVPVVGNFAGPKAIRSVAAYLKQKEQVVSAFYVSNVEQYLRQDGIWRQFCLNVTTLPLDATSTFIRSTRGGFAGVPRGGPGGFTSGLGAMAAEVAAGCQR
jgi:hypothetical protein